MKHKINIVSKALIMVAFVMSFANVASAATYEFINTSGQLMSVEANSPQEALLTAYQLGIHSGVILVDPNNNQVVVGQGNNLYQFINTSGQLTSVRADSPEEALRTAYQLAVHSGVILK